jgi:hypothetical protein
MSSFKLMFDESIDSTTDITSSDANITDWKLEMFSVEIKGQTVVLQLKDKLYR